SEIMQVKIEIQPEKIRLRPAKSEVDRLWADNTKAEKLLGWKPEFAGYEGLKRGLAETINWFRQNKNLKRYHPEVYNL
ncbi:MAG: NAD-dependent dehydratase, partial [Desulfitobacterium hafniense]|nr:NAD-dependent dehydratase [Desulfitobacterium hafniense]